LLLLMLLLLLLLHRAAEDAAKAQESITSTLRRTRQKMYDEVLRGSETIHSLRTPPPSLPPPGVGA
jgi:hypothetical protein